MVLEQIPMKPDLAAWKAEQVVMEKHTLYVLGAGGRYPRAREPFTVKDGKLGCDCVGFTCWTIGIDRFQPGVPKGTIAEYGGWINCDSAIGDATGAQQVFEVVDKPQVGDWIVYPSKRPWRRHGHVCIIVAVHADTSTWTAHLWARPKKERKKFLAKLEVVDCSASWWRKLAGRAVQLVTGDKSWNKPDAMFIRFKHWST